MICGYGGINSAGRSSSDLAYKRLVFDLLSEDMKNEVVEGVFDDDGYRVDADIEIQPQFIDVGEGGVKPVVDDEAAEKRRRRRRPRRQVRIGFGVHRTKTLQAASNRLAEMKEFWPHSKKTRSYLESEKKISWR